MAEFLVIIGAGAFAGIVFFSGWVAGRMSERKAWNELINAGIIRKPRK